jgi:hypothetical protein
VPEQPRDDQRHQRPEGVDDATVEAVGKVSEALEYVHRVRGAVYELHQLTGRADLLFGEAVELLRAAGHDDVAGQLQRDIVGRNLLPGRWTFQIVEEFDEGYYEPAVAAERRIRDALMAGRPHVYESEMKERRRTPGRPGHQSRPDEG